MRIWKRELAKSTGNPIGPLKVESTVWRIDAGGDFLIQIHKNLKKSGNIGAQCIVSDSRPDSVDTKPRAVVAKVAINNDLALDQVRLDATLRAALLVDEDSVAFVHKLTGGSRWRRILEALFRPKRLWAYSMGSIAVFMEKELCGIEEPTRRILGLESRDQVRLEHVFYEDRRFKVALATPILFEMSVKQVDDAHDSLPPKITKILERSGLPIVRLDKDIRMQLANENLERMLRSGHGTDGVREICPLSPVRLSISLPFFLQTRASFYAVGLFLGIPGLVIGLWQLSQIGAIIAGIVGGIGFIPIAVLWDIRRIRGKVG